MELQYGKAVDAGVKEVLGSVAFIETVAQEPYVVSQEKILGEISAIIGFSGKDLEGGIIIHFNRKLAFHLLQAIFETETTEITDEVLDAVGEVTNMISGKFKTELVGQGCAEFNISVPTIVVGQNYLTYIRGVKAPSTIYPYTCQAGDEFINIELKVQRR